MTYSAERLKSVDISTYLDVHLEVNTVCRRGVSGECTVLSSVLGTTPSVPSGSGQMGLVSKYMYLFDKWRMTSQDFINLHFTFAGGWQLTLRVHMADCKWCGTDEYVVLQVVGAICNYTNKNLDMPGMNDFEAGQ